MSLTYPLDPVSAVKIAKTDFAANKAAMQGRVQALLDMDVLLMRKPLPLSFAEASVLGSTYEIKKTFWLYVPDWLAGSGTKKLQVWLDMKVDNGTGHWRLKDVSSGNLGTDVTTTSTTYVSTGPGELTILQAWSGLRRQFRIEAAASNPAYTVFVKSVDRYTMRGGD